MPTGGAAAGRAAPSWWHRRNRASLEQKQRTGGLLPCRASRV